MLCHQDRMVRITSSARQPSKVIIDEQVGLNQLVTQILMWTGKQWLFMLLLFVWSSSSFKFIDDADPLFEGSLPRHQGKGEHALSHKQQQYNFTSSLPKYLCLH